MRRGALLLALLAFASCAPAAGAHAAKEPPGYVNIFYDCPDDYGPHARNPAQKGHDIVQVDAGEIEVDGERRFAVHVTLGKGLPGDSTLPRREELRFSVAGRAIATTVQTNDDATFNVVAGVPATIVVRGSIAEDGVPDEARLGLELQYTYAAMGAYAGDVARSFSVQGHVNVGSWQKGDYAPGGAFEPGRGDVETCVPMAPGSFEFSHAPPRPANIAPTAAFSVSPDRIVAGANVTFTDQSTDPEGPLRAWSWTFGDGGASEVQSPVHAYAEPGAYTVRLVVTDAASETSLAERVVTVVGPDAPARADFSYAPVNARAGEPVRFTDASAPGTTPLASWRWSFGDNATATGREANHTFAKPGTYNVTLEVRDEAGLVANRTRQLTIGPGIVASIHVSAPVVRANGTIELRPNVSEPDAIVRYAWDLGDGTRTEAQTLAHVYAEPGTYRVVLTLTDARGVARIVSTNITVLPPATSATASGRPEADFVAPTTLLVRERATLRDATVSPTPVRAWRWSIDGVAVGTTQNLTHTFAEPGRFEVKLVVTDNEGRESAKTRFVTVAAPDNAPPVVSIHAPAAAVAGTPLTLRASATDADGAIVSYRWDFGDGSPESDEAAPNHTYARPGAYDVRLVVRDDAGAIAEDVVTLTVRSKPAPTPGFETDPVAPVAGARVHFLETTPPATVVVTRRAWSFGDGNASPDADPIHRYARPGTYEVTLDVTWADGQTARASRTLDVRPAPAEPSASPPIGPTAASPAPSVVSAVAAETDARAEVPLAGLLGALAALGFAARLRRRA